MADVRPATGTANGNTRLYFLGALPAVAAPPRLRNRRWVEEMPTVKVFETIRAIAIAMAQIAPNPKAGRIRTGPSQVPKAASNFTSPMPPPPRIQGRISTRKPTAKPARAQRKPVPPPVAVWNSRAAMADGTVSQLGIFLVR